MPKYVANIEAKVDLTDLENLKKEIKTLESTPIKLKLDANGINVASMIAQLNKQFAAAGLTAGSSLANGINKSAKTVSLDSFKDFFNRVKGASNQFAGQLQQSFKDLHIDNATFDDVLKTLNEAKYVIKEISTSTGQYGDFQFNIKGVDSLNNAVTILGHTRDKLDDFGKLTGYETVIDRFNTKQLDVSGTVAGLKLQKETMSELEAKAKELGAAQKEAASVYAKYGSDSTAFKNAQRDVQNLSQEYTKLKQSAVGIVSQEDIDRLDKLAAKEREVRSIMSKDATNKSNAAQKQADAEATEQQVQAYNKLKAIITEIGKYNVELRGLDPTEDAAKIELYENKIQELSKEYEQVKNSMSKPLTSGQTAQLDAELEKTSMKLQEFEAKINDARVSAEKSITLKINDDNWSETFSGLKGEITELKAKGSESVSALSDELKQLKATRDSLKGKTGDELISGFEKYEEQLQSLQTHIKTAKNELKGLASAASISRTSSSFETWLSKNTKALDHYGDEIDKVRQKLMEFKDVGATTAELNSVKTAIDNIKSTAAAEGNVGVSWIGKLGDQFKKLSTYVSAASVIYTGIRALKDIVSNVTSIDSALVELKKVTSETDATYSQFLDNAKSKAVELGTSITDIVNSTADFARLGYSITDATTLAENASIFLRVADNMDSIDTATSVLVSTMKAYNIEASDSMSIIDRLNSVSNNYAVTTGGLGEALSRGASSFAASRNSLDESLALITAANEIVQDDAATGTAFKTNFCLYVQKCA